MTDAERAVREVRLAINGLKNEPTEANHTNLWSKFDRAIEAVRREAFSSRPNNQWISNTIDKARRDENEVCAEMVRDFMRYHRLHRFGLAELVASMRARIGKEGE